MSKPKSPRSVDAKSALASNERLRTSPRKLNLVAQMIRGRSVAEALYLLTFSPRRIAGDVKKVLQSAIANAENNHALDVDRLTVREATVGTAMVMKRFHARGRGKASSVVKSFSKIRIVVSEREREEAKAAAKPAAKKTATKSAPKAAKKA